MGGWYFREGIFHGDLHGLPVKDALRSTVAMYRVHEQDALHFKKRFRLEFKNPFVDEARPFRYSAISSFRVASTIRRSRTKTFTQCAAPRIRGQCGFRWAISIPTSVV